MRSVCVDKRRNDIIALVVVEGDFTNITLMSMTADFGFPGW